MNLSKFLKSLFLCLSFLKSNKIIAYPTEGVFGLGCNPNSKSAILNLISFKKRNFKKKFILLSDRYEKFKPYFNENYINFFMKKRFIKNSLNFITSLLPANPKNPFWISGRKNLVAVRITNHIFLKKLCFLYGKPIISTSANFSGNFPCTSYKEIKKIFGNNIPILKGCLGSNKKSSKILNMISGEIIRE